MDDVLTLFEMVQFIRNVKIIFTFEMSKISVYVDIIYVIHYSLLGGDGWLGWAYYSINIKGEEIIQFLKTSNISYSEQRPSIPRARQRDRICLIIFSI